MTTAKYIHIVVSCVQHTTSWRKITIMKTYFEGKEERREKKLVAVSRKIFIRIADLFFSFFLR